jgi:hypothetical protein
MQISLLTPPPKRTPSFCAFRTSAEKVLQKFERGTQGMDFMGRTHHKLKSQFGSCAITGTLFTNRHISSLKIDGRA